MRKKSIPSSFARFLGTVVLFAYWPSFVGAEVTGAPDQATRCTINTYVSLCASTLATFLLSGLGTDSARLRPADVQNASLAGGVGIGAIARLEVLGPGGALVVGLAAGALSTFGFATLQPRLLTAIGLHDTCGVHNLHGLPALLSGAASALLVAVSAPSDVFVHSEAAPLERAGFQLLATLLTFVVSLGAGTVVGALASKAAPRGDHYVTFHDSVGWDGDDHDAA